MNPGHNPEVSIPPCPTIEGRHRWLMTAGWACRKAGKSLQETEAYLRDHLTRAPSPADEIEQAVKAVYSDRCSQGVIHRSGWSKTGRWPAANPMEIRKICARGSGIKQLREMSPVKLPEFKTNTATVLRALFYGDPLLCVGSTRNFATLPLSEVVCIGHMLEMIVPSPMTSVWGKTQSGKLSQHTLEATGRRRFIVVEGDGTTKEEQAAVLLHLGFYAPLALVVDSGGKSLHGWFYCQLQSEADNEAFFAWACCLGADKQMWQRSQFVRMPDGLRNNGKKQRVLFFNPEVAQ